MKEDAMKEHQELAHEKIKSLYDTPEGEFGPTLFVSHHLDELDRSDWVGFYKTASPKPDQILNSLVLVDSWSSKDDGNIDMYDFSLPNDMTNYLLSARVVGGEAVDVSMDS